ncbi:MAG: RtcB family protein [Eubacterium sp.]|nr:RtcB family protein [Eubacterium sp.]
MEIINGTYTSAGLHLTENTENRIDGYAKSQIEMLCNTEALSGSRIRIMPDVHPGKVGTIGFTATIGDRLMPLLIGIDIGCGMTMAHISKGKKEWQKLDTVIRENIPSGPMIRKTPHSSALNFDFGRLDCVSHIQNDRGYASLGTLGGGNHFIEVDTDGDGLYLVVHSGSRHLGKEITDYYVSKGQKHLKNNGIDIPYELTWIDSDFMQSYIRDVGVATEYAKLNRHIIIEEILKGMKWKADDVLDCPHNFIASDVQSKSVFGNPILRKGAISAMDGEKAIIPINMRDGIILGIGMGNVEWNCSAPHGAGRILKREDVKTRYTVSSYKLEMKGIYSSCIGKETLDEAPFAYRNLDDIRDVLGETVKITKVLKPLYNYKAGTGK